LTKFCKLQLVLQLALQLLQLALQLAQLVLQLSQLPTTTQTLEGDFTHFSGGHWSK
jgi:hypothetical protein